MDSVRRTIAVVVWWVALALFVGSVLALWLACMNYFIVQANRVTPPRLDSGAMALLGGGLLAALLGWVVRMLIFFNHPHADL